MGHHHGSDTPTSARAVLHHTDQKGPKIVHSSVVLSAGKILVNVYVIWPWGQLLQRVLQKHKF